MTNVACKKSEVDKYDWGNYQNKPIHAKIICCQTTSPI